MKDSIRRIIIQNLGQRDGPPKSRSMCRAQRSLFTFVSANDSDWHFLLERFGSTLVHSPATDFAFGGCHDNLKGALAYKRAVAMRRFRSVLWVGMTVAFAQHRHSARFNGTSDGSLLTSMGHEGNARFSVDIFYPVNVSDSFFSPSANETNLTL